MNIQQMADVMEGLFESCRVLRSSGQKEYAGGDNAFGNFERLALKLQIPREKVLMTYFEKHIDGIYAHINGHISQREPVTGRIKDAIVYLTLLYGMVMEIEQSKLAGEANNAGSVDVTQYGMAQDPRFIRGRTFPTKPDPE